MEYSGNRSDDGDGEVDPRLVREAFRSTTPKPHPEDLYEPVSLGSPDDK